MVITLIATPDPEGMSWPYVVEQPATYGGDSRLVITWDVPPRGDIPND